MNGTDKPKEFIVMRDCFGNIFSQITLVRCGDCKHFDDGECRIKQGWFPVKHDWFCADGEKRNEE